MNIPGGDATPFLAWRKSDPHSWTIEERYHRTHFHIVRPCSAVHTIRTAVCPGVRRVRLTTHGGSDQFQANTPKGVQTSVSAVAILGPGLDELELGNSWAGALRAFGGRGGDSIAGTNGSDDIHGGRGDDSALAGGDGADLIAGGPGKDFLYGNRGADLIRGGSGPDYVDAGRGADRINVADGEADSVVCGPGSDVVRLDPGDFLPDRADCERIVGQG